MQPTRGSWGEVQVFSYIQDRNGKTWRVDKLSTTRVRLSDRDGRQVDILRPTPAKPVTIFIPTDEEARFTLAAALGARVMASRDVTGEYHCTSPDAWDLDVAKWHMHRFHREDCDHLELSEILARHEGDDAPVPHDHLEPS
jgi:hypothetical protein